LSLIQVAEQELLEKIADRRFRLELLIPSAITLAVVHSPDREDLALPVKPLTIHKREIG
jgi:hypothetical protein